MLVLFSTMLTLLRRDEPVSTDTSPWAEPVASGLRPMQRSAAICNVVTRIKVWIQTTYRTLDVDSFRRRRVQWFSLASARVKCRAPRTKEERS
jgi:hypothetical protein